MTRGGRDKDRDQPERRCIVTGQSQPKGGLIRFVVGPDAQLIPDLLERLPGRGIWVSADRAAVEKAVKKGLFARAARQPVQAGDLLPALEDGLARRVTELLSLARKGGAAVAGFEKVKDWLVKGQAGVLVQACDGSERGKTKLRPPEPENPGDTTFIGCLTADELGLAFGREHVIHAALAAGGLTARVVDEARKLSGIRGQIGGEAAGKDTKDA